MYGADFTIKTSADRVYRHLDKQEINEEMKNWANEQLREIQEDLDQVLQFDDGYRDFLLDYVPREVEKFSADSVEDIPYDELREHPICTCDDFGCWLKAGRLPKTVTEAESVEDGIEEFKQEHRGSPEVLTDAADAWREKRRDCWYVLRYIESHMGPDREEPPDDPDADSSRPSAATAD